MFSGKGTAVDWRWDYPLLMRKVVGCYGRVLVWVDMVAVHVSQKLVGEDWPWMQRLSEEARFSVWTMQFVHTGIFPGNLECFPLAPNPFMMGMGFGGGFEFQFATSVAFFIECGGSLNFIVGNEVESFSVLEGGSPALSIGWRNYF